MVKIRIRKEKSRMGTGKTSIQSNTVFGLVDSGTFTSRGFVVVSEREWERGEIGDLGKDETN